MEGMQSIKKSQRRTELFTVQYYSILLLFSSQDLHRKDQANSAQALAGNSGQSVHNEFVVIILRKRNTWVIHTER